MPSIAPSPRAPVIVLVAKPYDSSTTVDLLDWPLPCGDIGLPVENQFSLQGAEVEVYAGTEARTTKPTDTPSNQWIGSHLAEPFNFVVELFSGIEPTGEKGQAGLGSIGLRDPAGDLDRWISLTWDGRALDLFRGPPGTNPADMEHIASLTCDAMLYDLSSKYFRMRDLQYRLYQSTFLLHRYAGTGTVEGDASLTGAAKPLAFGRLFQVEPTPLIAGLLIYQWHFRQVEEVTAVRDGGSPLTFYADFSSYEALVAATVPGGNYATCNALGLIRLGTRPTSGLRLDGKGDKYAGVYVETRAGIARRIATTIGDLPLGDPGNIDTASFAAMDLAQPAPVGIFLREDSGTVGDALDKLMAGCAGWWTMSLTGRMRVGFLDEPADVADYTLAQRPDFAGEPAMDDATPPRMETSVGWQRNWSPQDPATILGIVTEDNRRLYQALWSFSNPEYGRADNIAAQHLAARRVFVEGYYALQADADAEADRQRTLFSVPRRRWKIRLDVDPFTDLLGKTVEIIGVNRLGWGVSMKFRVIGIDAIVSAESCTLLLWG